MRRVFLGLASCLLAACGVQDLPAAAPPRGALHAAGARGKADPTVVGAHLVPGKLDADGAYGTEPGGGVRAIVLGMRVVSLPTGAALTSPDRLPQMPSTTIALPDRVGGGFLFQLGQTVWRAEKWLSAAHPIYQSQAGINRLVVGLDRVYVRTQNGAFQAFDARTGARTDMGPWPASPFVGAFAASDAWHAVATTDFRGVVATFDGGATWKQLGLPIDANAATAAFDSIVVSGHDVNRQQASYEVRADGQVAKLATPISTSAPMKAQTSVDPGARRFGKHPFVAAIEDGWPLTDGTALVARDGALARIRLSDGAVVEVADDSFDMKPSRCHPISLARPKDAAAFGFVCGEPRGKTILYAYDSDAGRLVELKSFDRPRVVLPSGNGALAVRGGCAADAPTDDTDRAQQSYCLFLRNDEWREIRVRGDVGGERVVVLTDGRVAVISPPRGDLATARLTLLDKGRAKTVPIAFPALPQDVARVLRLGVWLDGFEERRPGVLSGWVEGGGPVLGVEIALDGHAKHGKYIRDAGAPMVSGRYGLGFTGSRRGYETIDFGMTWTDIELPDPAIRDPRLIPERACGPVGCTAAGWLRIGWGGAAQHARPETPPAARPPPWHAAPALDLDCEAAAGPPPEPSRTTNAPREPDQPYRPHAYYPYYGYPPGWQGMRELPAFYTLFAPPLRADDLGIVLDVSEQAERWSRSPSPMLKLYTWGPKSGEWERTGKWLARWVWPYGGWPDIRSTQLTVAPFANLDAARRSVGFMPGMMPTMWQASFGDDPNHVLLLGRRQGASPVETEILAMETDRPPMEVRRSDGELLGEIEAVTRVGAHWYLVTPNAQHELLASIVWVVEGSFAREIARVPRGGFESRPAARLARRTDGRAVGLVVDGQPSPDRGVAQRWVLPIDLESGAMGEPEPLGPIDFGDRTLTPCRLPPPGWELDAPIATSTRVHIGGSNQYVQTPVARLVLSRDRTCVAMLSGSLEQYSGPANETFVRKGAAGAKPDGRDTITVAIASQRMRYPLRCSASQ